jgi:diguanylate cyclase (GGDEF)-like protein
MDDTDLNGAPLIEPLLGVHSAPNIAWLADAACTAAERGLGALHSLLLVTDSSGQLAVERPASTNRVRDLKTLGEELDVDLLAIRIDPHEAPRLTPILDDGHAGALPDLSDALPIEPDVGRQGWGVVALAPLHWNGETLGALVLVIPEEAFSLDMVEMLGRHAAVALHNLREQEAGRKRGELDAVRWVYDERRFLEQLAQETRRAQRHDRPLSILLLRVENITHLRANYGRFLADRVLRQVAGQLDDAMRDTDFLGAFGEDGFAAILVEADRDGARRAEERLLRGLAEVTVPNADLPELTARFACATATLPDDGATAEELIAAAEALVETEPEETAASAG